MMVHLRSGWAEEGDGDALRSCQRGVHINASIPIFLFEEQAMGAASRPQNQTWQADMKSSWALGRQLLSAARADGRLVSSAPWHQETFPGTYLSARRCHFGAVNWEAGWISCKSLP